MRPAMLDNLNWLALQWSAWMWSMSLHLAVLVVMLILLDALLRRASARLRFAIWLLVLARLMVPPSLAAPTGWMWWTAQWWPAVSQWTDWQVPADAVEVSKQTRLGVEYAHVTDPSPVQAPVQSTTLVGIEAAPSAWPSILLLIWLGAVAAQLGLMVYGWWLVRNWLAQALPVEDAAVLRLLESAQARVGFRAQGSRNSVFSNPFFSNPFFSARVRLLNSGRCTTPMIVGWRRPVILLPSAVLETLNASELESVLVHELIHMKRGDYGWRILQSLFSALYFFHPAVWVANRFLSRTCEEACDELTVRALAGRRREYAEAIFKAAALVGYQGPHLAMNMLGDALPIKHRLSRILDPRLPQDSGGSWRHALIALSLALVLLPTGTRRTHATPPQSTRLSDLRVPSDFMRADSEVLSIALEPSNMITTPTIVAATTPSQASTAKTDSEGGLTPGSDVESMAERAALEQIKSDQFEVRMQGYAQLRQVGTIRSLPALESAFLNRSGLEQDAAEEALKHVWDLIRAERAATNNTTTNSAAKVFRAFLEN